MSALRRKKCETLLPSAKKGAGARYIRQFLSSRVEKRGGRTIHSSIFVFKARRKGRAHDTFDKLSLQVPQGGSPHGGDPTESPEEVDFTIQTGLLEHSLGGRSKPQFGLLLACPWLLQGAYFARVGTSRGKKCESEYTSQKKVRNIPSKYEQTGRAQDTFDKLSLQVLKKKAGARFSLVFPLFSLDFP